MSEDLQQQAAEEVESVAVESVETEATETEQREPQQEPVESDESKEDKSRKHKVQQRFDEITRARHEAEREAAYWRNRAEGNAKAEPQAKPEQSNFKDYDAYVEALTDWKADQKVNEALSKRDTERAREAETQAQQAKVNVFSERQQAIREALPDYDEVIGMSDVQIANHVGDALIRSKKGAELAYHLAKNPDVAEQLNAMHPLDAAVELGSIAANLTFEKPTPVVKPVSKAPAPIAPIGSRAAPAKDPDKMDADEWRTWREEQLKRR
jgi:hypothetical protein